MAEYAGVWADLTVGVLLAGGQSRRMGGGDKSLMPLNGTPMLGHAIARLRPQVGALVVNANGDPSRFDAFGLPVVADTIEGFAGPLAGVLAGMEWAAANRPKARWIVTAACDTPFFPADLTARAVAAVGHFDDMVALAASGGRLHPVFGLWPIALREDLSEWLAGQDNRKVLAWTDRHQMAEVSFSGFTIDDIEIDPFFNVNTPDDIAVAEAVLAELAEAEPAS
jgi:molybdopterin-guanine dinucleotide biosynthesis protein A